MKSKKISILALAVILTALFSTPSFALAADKPYDETARAAATELMESMPAGSFRTYLEGGYELSGYELEVSESYVDSFLSEAKKTPMLKNFNLSQYNKMGATVVFFPENAMMGVDGFSYEKRLSVAFGAYRDNLDHYKTIANHELLHAGTEGLGMDWLCEAFVVLASQRIDEECGRKTLEFDGISPGRNDYAIAQYVASVIGGEENFAKLAGRADAYERIRKAFDASNKYISFNEFAFATAYIREDNSSELFEKNLEYLAYMTETPSPADGEKASEIKDFYTRQGSGNAFALAEALSGISGSEAPTVQCLDMLLYRASYVEWEKETVMQIKALELARELLTPKDAQNFPWADAVVAYNLTRFAEEAEIPVSPEIAMTNVEGFALAGELLAKVFGEKNVENFDMEEIEKIYAKRTGGKLSELAAAAETTPQAMLSDIYNLCFTQPVANGLLEKEKAAEEISGFVKEHEVGLKNWRMLDIFNH